jgi:hypothetical protein
MPFLGGVLLGFISSILELNDDLVLLDSSDPLLIAEPAFFGVIFFLGVV